MRKIVCWLSILSIGLPVEIGQIRLNEIFFIIAGIISTVCTMANGRRKLVNLDYMLIGLCGYCILGLTMGIMGCQFWPQSIQQYSVTALLMTVMLIIYNSRDLWAKYIYRIDSLQSIRSATIIVIVTYAISAIFQIRTGRFTGDYLYASPFYDNASVASANTILVITILFIIASYNLGTLIARDKDKQTINGEGERWIAALTGILLVTITGSRSSIAGVVIGMLLVTAIVICNSISSKKITTKRLTSLRKKELALTGLLIGLLGIAIVVILQSLNIINFGGVYQVNHNRLRLIEIFVGRMTDFSGGAALRGTVHMNELTRLGKDSYIYGAGFGCYEYSLGFISRVLHGTHTRILVSSGIMGLIIIGITTTKELLGMILSSLRRFDYNKIVVLFCISYLVGFGYGYDIFGISSTIYIIAIVGIVKEISKIKKKEFIS